MHTTKTYHNKHTQQIRAALFCLCIFLFSSLQLKAADADVERFPLGPIGAIAYQQAGTNAILIEQVQGGLPGDLAGLQVGDYLLGVNGKAFSNYGGAYGAVWIGPTTELGYALDKAHQAKTAISLMIFRPGTGNLTVDVTLPETAATSKVVHRTDSLQYDQFLESCAQIHNKVQSGTQGHEYNQAWFGLTLLAHPDWNTTSGDTPYGLSVVSIRDYMANIIMNEHVYDPADTGTGEGSSNWFLGGHIMFLSEYRIKLGTDISFSVGNPATSVSLDAVIQRGVEMLRNSIQDGVSDWQVGPFQGWTTGDFPTTQWGGHTGHGGHLGEYVNGQTDPQATTGAFNVTSAHVLSGLSWATKTNADFSAIQTNQFGTDWSVQDKWDLCWEYLKASTNMPGQADPGNIGYMGNGQDGWDSAVRTSGAYFAFRMHDQEYTNRTADDVMRSDLQREYLVSHWQRMQHAHAYTSGGYVFNQLALPFYSNREQDFFRENTRYIYPLMAGADGSVNYFPGRGNNGGDFYLGWDNVGYTYGGLPYAIASGNLPSLPAVNTTRNYLETVSPDTTWPKLEARYARLTGLSHSLDVDVKNWQGDPETNAITAAWTQVSAPAGESASFTDAAALDTTVNFSANGSYRLKLTVTVGAEITEEVYDFDVVNALSAPAGYVLGQANYRIYEEISGTAVTDLTGNAKYPNSPDLGGFVSSLQSVYSGNNYGQRISGYIVPPATGFYTFYITSDDTSEFKINDSGVDPAGAVAICSVNTFTSQYQWDKETNQTSVDVLLTAGQPYYFEINHKEGSGGDHCAVAWTGPGIATPTVVPGENLAIQEGSSVILKQPSDVSVAAGSNASFSVVVEGEGPHSYTWKKDGVAYWGNSLSSSLSVENVGAGSAGSYTCDITTPTGVITSNVATLTVTGVGSYTTGGLWREVYDSISGNSVSDLTSAATFPSFPDSGSVITSAASPPNDGSSYGARWTGWLTPDVTGNYTFYLASDDASELWLSTNNQPNSKVKIAEVIGYTGEKNWSGGASSASISLTAGTAYYIEVLHKEGGGSAHCAVAWRKPSEAAPTNGSGEIPSQYLSYLTGGIHSDTVGLSITQVSPAVGVVSIPSNVGLDLEIATTPALSVSDTVMWSTVSGPGSVSFEDPSSLNSGATFSADGDYVLRCTITTAGVPNQHDISVSVGAAQGGDWLNASIAEPVTGSGVQNPDGSIVISGSGNDIYASSDQFHYFYQNLEGDFDIKARLASKSVTGGSGAHAQIMARESTAGGSRNVAVSHEKSQWLVFQNRTFLDGTTNYDSDNNAANTVPKWLRLTRIGQIFTGYVSDDGVTWTQRGTVEYNTAMPDTLMVGFAVSNGSSNSSSALNNVVFDNVEGFGATGNIGPDVEAGTLADTDISTPINLAGVVNDDGLPVSPGSVITT